MRARFPLNPPCVYPHLPFFLLINTSLASLLSVSMWKFISTQLMGQGLVTYHWCQVVQWLGFSTLPAAARLQSLAGNRNPASSRCRPRPPEIKKTFCLFPDGKGKEFSISPLNMMLVVSIDYSQMLFIRLKFLSIPNSLRVLSGIDIRFCYMLLCVYLYAFYIFSLLIW